MCNKDCQTQGSSLLKTLELGAWTSQKDQYAWPATSGHQCHSSLQEGHLLLMFRAHRGLFHKQVRHGWSSLFFLTSLFWLSLSTSRVKIGAGRLDKFCLCPRLALYPRTSHLTSLGFCFLIHQEKLVQWLCLNTKLAHSLPQVPTRHLFTEREWNCLIPCPAKATPAGVRLPPDGPPLPLWIKERVVMVYPNPIHQRLWRSRLHLQTWRTLGKTGLGKEHWLSSRTKAVRNVTSSKKAGNVLGRLILEPKQRVNTVFKAGYFMTQRK